MINFSIQSRQWAGNFKAISFLIFSALVMTFISCGDTQEGSKEHLYAKSMSDSIKVLQEKSEAIVLDMQTIKVKLEEHLEESDSPDSLVSQLIFSINEDIAASEGIIKKHETLINQHEKYIDLHETTALAVDNIKLQHEQIEADFSKIHSDLIFLEQKLYTVKEEAQKYIDLDEIMVIFHKK